MPRTARIDWPGAVQHSFTRGIEKTAIFLDDADHERFLTIFQEVLERTGTRCSAWCLMKDHYHLAIQAGEGGLSHVMHCINTRYAMYFNRRWDRVGHLFQGRFGSKIHEGDDAQQGLVGYVHGNALAAGICRTIEDLEAYPWSGHRELMGIVSPRLIDVKGVLRLFGPDQASARSALTRRLQRECSGPTPGGKRPDLTTVSLTSRSQFGLPAFGLEAIVTPQANLERIAGEAKDRTLRSGIWLAQGGSIESLTSVVCLALGARLDDLRAGRRKPREVLARSVVAHVACDVLTESGASVARAVGISRQGIAGARTRGREMVARLGIETEQLLKDALDLRGGGGPG